MPQSVGCAGILNQRLWDGAGIFTCSLRDGAAILSFRMVQVFFPAELCKYSYPQTMGWGRYSYLSAILNDDGAGRQTHRLWNGADIISTKLGLCRIFYPQTVGW